MPIVLQWLCLLTCILVCCDTFSIYQYSTSSSSSSSSLSFFGRRVTLFSSSLETPKPAPPTTHEVFDDEVINAEDEGRIELKKQGKRAATFDFVSQDEVFAKEARKAGGDLEATHFERTVPLYTSDREKLLFLPGLDGVGDYSAAAFYNLSKSFDITRLKIDPEDRSSFTQIGDAVISFLEEEKAKHQQPVVLMGESFGGLLATYVSLRSKEKALVSKLILVNPATSYDRTPWSTLGPLVASTGPAFPVVGISTLLATVIEPNQIETIGRPILDRINTIDDLQKELNSLLAASETVTKLLSPDTLNHRLTKWLGGGTFLMKDRYKEIVTPTVILVGTDDRLLPSGTEGRRLEDEIGTNALVDLQEFPTRGHALLDPSFDLVKVLNRSKVFAKPKPPRSLDCPYPTKQDLAEVDKQFGFLTRGTSPIFLSMKNGRLQRGIGDVPTGKEGRPVLLVGNHQLYGGDLSLIIRKFIEEKETLIRGLAHPIIFSDASQGGFGGGQAERGPGGPRGDRNSNNEAGANENGNMRNLFEKFGAVEVSPNSIFELLRRNETVLLFPGGVREAYHGKGEDYALFWPEKVDFVRMAGLFNAQIVPFSAIGIADSVEMVLDGKEILDLPVLGDRAKRASKKAPNARAGIEDDFIAPIVIPKLTPSRCYFLFHDTVDTQDINIYNKKDCARIYNQIKNSVANGIVTLKRFREEDPYKDFLVRGAYETMTGKQAPTAPLNLKM